MYCERSYFFNPDQSCIIKALEVVFVLDFLSSALVHFFNKQTVYKQLAFGWQIAKQLSGPNPFSLSNNKNYGIKKSGVFPF